MLITKKSEQMSCTCPVSSLSSSSRPPIAVFFPRGHQDSKNNTGSIFFLKVRQTPSPPNFHPKRLYIRLKMVILRHIPSYCMYNMYNSTTPVLHAFVGASHGSHSASLSVHSQSLSILNETFIYCINQPFHLAV